MQHKIYSVWLSLLLATSLLAASCSDNPPARDGGGLSDAGMLDAGAQDVGARDAGHQGADAASCTDECADESLTQCAQGGLSRCGDFDDDGCLEWGAPQACPGGGQCTDGACVSACTDEPCTEVGALACSQDGLGTVECGDFNGDGCLEWGHAQSCASGQTCSNGTCSASCSDGCTSQGAKRCEAGDVVTCDDYNSDGCLEWGDPQKLCHRVVLQPG